MNDIKIAEKTIRESFRNMANYMRRLEQIIIEKGDAGDEKLHDYYLNTFYEEQSYIGHQIAALSWAGFKITFTGYSKYRSKYAGDPHITYVGFANRKEA